ncbi:MAG: FixH family protein [Phycisphaerales bacterium]|jgi:hypothetical protein
MTITIRVRCMAVLLGICASTACDRSEPNASNGPADGAMASAASGERVSTADIPSEVISGEGPTAGGSYFVRWRSGPDGIPALETFSLEVDVESAAGEPLSDEASVSVDAAMPHHGHGMNFVPDVTRIGSGRYLVEGMLFHMRGRWELFVDVERDGVLERAQWTVVLE